MFFSFFFPRSSGHRARGPKGAPVHPYAHAKQGYSGYGPYPGAFASPAYLPTYIAPMPTPPWAPGRANFGPPPVVMYPPGSGRGYYPREMGRTAPAPARGVRFGGVRVRQFAR